MVTSVQCWDTLNDVDAMVLGAGSAGGKIFFVSLVGRAVCWTARRGKFGAASAGSMVDF